MSTLGYWTLGIIGYACIGAFARGVAKGALRQKCRMCSAALREQRPLCPMHRHGPMVLAVFWPLATFLMGSAFVLGQLEGIAEALFTKSGGDQ